jgi:NCS1 family nucleobase:cation symporter-1
VSAGIDQAGKLAVEGSWPVVPGQRTWTGRALFFVMLSMATATWLYPLGGFTASYVGAEFGTLIIAAAVMMGVLVTLVAVCPSSTRYGIDSLIGSVPFFGTRGSYLSLALLFAAVLGWNATLTIFSGRAGAEILIATGIMGEGARGTLELAVPIIGIVGVFLLLRSGPERIRNLAPFIAVGIAVLGVWILVLLVGEVGFSGIADATPAYADDSKLWNFTAAWELNFAATLSWWPYLGAMVRLSRRGRDAGTPVFWGLAIPVVFLTLVGLYAGLAVPESGGDPTTFLVDIGGLSAGIPALLFLVFANFGTLMVGAYVVAIGLKVVPSVQRSASWRTVLALALAPVAFVTIVLPGPFFDNIGTFLAFLGVAFAPLIGIQLVDYFLFRRQVIDVRSLYIAGPAGRYHFWSGVNPAGMLGMAAGVALYLYLLDPVNFTSRAPFEYVTASLPSMALAGLVYAVITKLVVMPAGRGGYEKEEAAASPEPMPVTHA